MNNQWNKWIYKVWSPVYDLLFNKGFFLKARKQIFQEIDFQCTERILFAGVGTGADLELIDHSHLNITAIDYSPDMLQQARKKFPYPDILFLEMDAQNMDFEDNSFDIIAASLILSVVPDPKKGMREMVRVLKPGGQLIVFDKFSSGKSSLAMGFIRGAIKILGTDIGLNFKELISDSKNELLVEEDEPIMFNGMYRKIILRKMVS
jgi:phosphatidylethanolamine/phosphatidyl-N-methylethanolamine N-methyltransferase